MAFQVVLVEGRRRKKEGFNCTALPPTAGKHAAHMLCPSTIACIIRKSLRNQERAARLLLPLVKLIIRSGILGRPSPNSVLHHTEFSLTTASFCTHVPENVSTR